MTDVDALVEASGDLKRALVAFGRQPRFGREFTRAAQAQGFDPNMADDLEAINFTDFFVLQHRLADGRTVVERFLDSRRGLPEDQRQAMLAWRDVVEGVFEVDRRDGEALLATNLIDELNYRIRSNIGPDMFRKMRRGSFLIARLLPVGDQWLISGTCNLVAARDKDSAFRYAASAARRNPRLVFRNPAFLERAWELQRAEHERFIRFFGSDLIVLPGDQVDKRLHEFHQFTHQEIEQATPRRRRPRASSPPRIDLDLDPDMRASDSVALIYDETDGMNFFADFGQISAVYADPTLLRQQRHRQQLLDYLRDDSVTPLPFRRLAERHPDTVNTLFAKLLRKPGFDWQRDGETLMRQRKAAYFAAPTLPSITPLGDRLATHLTHI